MNSRIVERNFHGHLHRDRPQEELCRRDLSPQDGTDDPVKGIGSASGLKAVAVIEAIKPFDLQRCEQPLSGCRQRILSCSICCFKQKDFFPIFSKHVLASTFQKLIGELR